MSMLKEFKADCRGNIAILFSLAALPLCLGVGVAVDMAQTNRALTVLQGAADAAALAGGSSGAVDDAVINATVTNYLKANGAEDLMASIADMKWKLDKAKRIFSVTVKGERKTSLMHMAGFSKTEIGAYSEVNLGGDGLEVALVLDNTASMNESGRIGALKVAAKQLVTDLMKVEDTGAYVRVGLVPFAQYVNVGVSSRGESWLDVPPDSSKTVNWCRDVYENPPTESNCRMEPVVRDGVNTGTEERRCDYNYSGPYENVCTPVTETITWKGCVGSRSEPLDEQLGALATRYPGMVNTDCVSQIVDLSNDESKLNNAIDGMVTNGDTYIPQGLLWGWNMLDNNKPLDNAKSKGAISAMGGSKSIILMSDGTNTLAPYAPHHWGADPGDSARGAAKMEVLCQKIKDDGIVIYTVSFMISDAPTRTRMTDCASQPSKAFTADTALELSQAFKEIGASLASLRLTK